MSFLIRALGKTVVQAASAKIATEMAKPESRERLAAAAAQLAERARAAGIADAAGIESKIHGGIRALGRAFADARRPPNGE